MIRGTREEQLAYMRAWHRAHAAERAEYNRRRYSAKKMAADARRMDKRRATIACVCEYFFRLGRPTE
jgi:hypothetical protein